MKKIFLAALVAASAMTASAQVYVGIGAGYTSVKPSEGDATNTFMVAPEIGYSFSEKTGVGVEFNYSSVKAGDADAVNVWSLQPYFRYNAINLDGAKIFVDAALVYNNYGKDAGTGIGLAIKPGLSVNLSDKVALVGKVNVLSFVKDNEDAGKSTHFGVGTNQASVGVVFNF